MAIAIAFSAPQGKSLMPVTVSITGMAPSVAHIGTCLNPSGHTYAVTFTSDGSGNMSFPFVPPAAGKYVFSVAPVAPAASASGTYLAGGQS